MKRKPMTAAQRAKIGAAVRKAMALKKAGQKAVQREADAGTVRRSRDEARAFEVTIRGLTASETLSLVMHLQDEFPDERIEARVTQNDAGVE